MKASHLVKQKIIEDLKKRISENNTLILTDMSGLKVSEISALRAELSKVGAVYTVVKNRLFARAAKEVGIELSEPLKGPTAFLFSNDPVSACKVLSGFIKREKRPSVKFGFLENRKVLPEEIVKIAKLPEREVLLSQVLSGLSGPISGLAGVLSGIIRRLIYTIRAVQEKKR